ncbi:MAG: hypothetical protein LBQ20_00930 [Rhodanobacter sp.]|jgi:hypothetical protein|nr:hypothetical protein [Rhodanobacter sp.]
MSATRFALASLLLLSALSAHALDIKGNKIGDTLNEVQARQPLDCGPLYGHKECQKQGDYYLRGRYSETYAGERVSILYTFHNDVLVKILVTHLQSSSYDDIEKQLKVKFGAPTSRETTTAKDHDGATLPNHVVRWKSGKHELMFERYNDFTDDFEESRLELVDTDYRAGIEPKPSAADKLKDM